MAATAMVTSAPRTNAAGSPGWRTCRLVPRVAAATLGTSLHVLQPGEPAALVLGALVTIAVAAIAGGAAVRQGHVGPLGDTARAQRTRRTRPSSQTGSSDS